MNRKFIWVGAGILVLVLILAGFFLTTMTKEKIAVIETSLGNIEVELNAEKAPITVENFENYVKSHFYDGTIFHRVIPGFMIQGGGFTQTGQQKPTNAPIKLESNNGLKNNKGTIAMARTNVPDSATGQFFINLEDNDFLDYASGNPGYAVFGEVVSGIEVVEKIGKVQTGVKLGMQDWPTQDIVVKRVYFK
jgi:cyclophilin family peptidyl-prolyl cis-trans isomerase